MTDSSTWRIEAERSSITTDIEQATLVLRLGNVVNSIRAAQRFYWFSRDADGPGGQRDRMWAFLLAASYLNEALLMLRYRFPAVRTLAERGGVTEAVIKDAGNLLSGKAKLTPMLARLRNELVFHWDEEPIREFARNYSKDVAVWVEGRGDTNGESFYAVAADAISNSILPDDPAEPDTPERNEQRIRELMVDVTVATKTLTELFGMAILGHLRQHDAKQVGG